MVVMVDVCLLKETLAVMKRLTNRTPIHIMTFARVVVCDGVITLESFNGSTGINRIVGSCDGRDDISFGLPIDQALSVLRPVVNGMVEIESGRIVIGDMSIQLDMCDHIDPWPISMSEVDSPVSVMADDLKRIGGVVYAASTDSSRYNLGTVCIDGSWAVASDGARLAIRDLAVSFEQFGNVVINRDVVGLMVAMFGKNCDMTRWSIFDKHLVVKSPSWSISSERLADYPDYKRVLMTNYQADVEYMVDRKQLLDVLKRFKPLTSNRDRGVRVSLDNGRVMMVARNGSEVGVPIEVLSGNGNGSWLVNMIFMVDASTAISGSKRVIISEYRDRRVITINDEALIMLLRENNN